MLTLGSLFDGIGGWLLAAKHAGVAPVWASEIDDFPAAVTARHFPDVNQLGDITKIDVLEPVDIICAGSPCQDLSVAGKREGLAGERSGLFRTAIKLVHRLRARTGKPRFFVWENVPGAFGSNRGADFRTVLEEISQTEIPIPTNNKWADSGMVEWDGGSLAWRVLDAQYWGVPQRRKRIFLVADFAGHSAGEILFERKGLSGDSTESQGTREETAGNAGKGVDRAGETLTPWDVQSNRIQGINGKAAALYGGEGQGTHNGAVFDTRQTVIGVHENQQGEVWVTNKFTALSTGGGKPDQDYPCVACYDISHRQDVIRPQENGTLPCLTARADTGGNNLPVVNYTIAGNTINRQIQNGGNGKGVLEEKSYTLNTIDRHAAVAFRGSSFGQYEKTDVAGTMKAAGGDLGGGSETFISQKSVRRLTPLECERLQGLPDGYTDIEFNGKPAPDTRRYKAIGNGMAQPCADFVIRRIVESGKKGIDNMPSDVV